MKENRLHEKLQTLPDWGIYALLVWSDEQDLDVGALGTLHFERGYYVYIGSAQRNLQKRVERHLRREKKLRWHIDYLLLHARILDFTAAKLTKPWEEIVAQILQERYACVPHFGAGDSSAYSHLFYSPTLELWDFVKGIFERSVK